MLSQVVFAVEQSSLFGLGDTSGVVVQLRMFGRRVKTVTKDAVSLSIRTLYCWAVS